MVKIVHDKHKLPLLFIFKNLVLKLNINYCVVMFNTYYQTYICGVKKKIILTDIFLKYFMEESMIS